MKTFISFLFQPKLKLKLTITNPLWWIVGYFVIYPWRAAKNHYKAFYHQKIHYCSFCNKEIGNNLWGWCSIECLEHLTR